MKTLKYSSQREAIEKYLLSVTEHPTAEMVYLHIIKKLPNISLATVYRNLNLLVELGKAIKIKGEDGKVRYDAVIDDHYHFTCTRCSKVQDIHIEHFEHINHAASLKFDGKIDTHSIMFSGICKECLDKLD